MTLVIVMTRQPPLAHFSIIVTRGEGIGAALVTIIIIINYDQQELRSRLHFTLLGRRFPPTTLFSAALIGTRSASKTNEELPGSFWNIAACTRHILGTRTCHSHSVRTNILPERLRSVLSNALTPSTAHFVLLHCFVRARTYWRVPCGSCTLNTASTTTHPTLLHTVHANYGTTQHKPLHTASIRTPRQYVAAPCAIRYNLHYWHAPTLTLLLIVCVVVHVKYGTPLLCAC